MSKKNIAPICIYAELLHAFQHAQKDAKFLKMAFLPEQGSKTSWLLRIAVVMFFVAFTSAFATSSGWPFMIAMVLEGIILLLAEYEVQRGVRLAMPENSPVHNLNKQPWKLRRAVIRYAYFVRRLQTLDEKPSLTQLSSVLQITEINRTSRPPIWSGLLRHPMVTALSVGIFLYTFNTKIIGAPNVGMEWNRFSMVLLALVVLLSAASIVYTIRYMGPDEEWEFERCLRWYKLQLQDRPTPTKCGGTRAMAKGR